MDNPTTPIRGMSEDDARWSLLRQLIDLHEFEQVIVALREDIVERRITTGEIESLAQKLIVKSDNIKITINHIKSITGQPSITG